MTSGETSPQSFETSGRVTIVPERHGDAIVLAVKGEVDLVTAPQVEQAVDRAIQHQPSVLVVDLSHVDFLASAGMTVLVTGQHKAAEKIRFRVVATGQNTFRPMELTGLTEQLAVFATREEALNAPA